MEGKRRGNEQLRKCCRLALNVSWLVIWLYKTDTATMASDFLLPPLVVREGSCGVRTTWAARLRRLVWRKGDSSDGEL